MKQATDQDPIDNDQDKHYLKINMQSEQNSQFIDSSYSYLADDIHYNQIQDSEISYKTKHQFRALFYKSLSLQSKQVGTNICQISTPLICLAFVYLIKSLAESQFGSTFSLPYSFILNIPGLYNVYPYVDIQCQEWYLFDFDKGASNETKKFVGENTGNYGEKTEGLLGNLVQNNDCLAQKDGKDVIKKVPYMEKPPQDQTVNEFLYDTQIYLNEMPFERGRDIANLSRFPDGAITFYEASPINLTYKLQINDNRIAEYHRNNGITKIGYIDPGNQNKTRQQIRVAEGMLSLMDLVSRSYLRTINPEVYLISGVQYMPVIGEDKGFILRIISVTGASLYPLALSLLLPIFMYVIVLEKEEKLLEMMKMNGMRMREYWLMTFIFSFVITFFTFILFFLFGFFILELDFFTDTNQFVLIIVLLGWSIAQIALAFFFQVFLSKARSATIIGYLLSIWTSLISVTFNIAVYPDPYKIPYGMRLYPPFAFSRLIYDLSLACSNGVCYQNIGDFSEEMVDCLIFLYVGGLIFLILGMYLHEVWPQEYGTQKHVFFCIQRCLKKKQQNDDDKEQSIHTPLDEQGEDKDVKEERQFVYDIKQPYSQYPLICKDLRKIYDQVGGRNEHVAVKNCSLCVKKGEIFGLLGPNGAGKTTIISILTGIYSPTKGNCWVAGYDIKNQIEQVQINMGVCPQFDLLWPDLTVEEHLLFYARLKGIQPKQEKLMVESAMKEVYLTDFANYRTSQLSGGMRRRLSVAISLVGDPKIIFLDEPSTGLDPENRRQLWDIMAECRGKRAMVLTTHSMEEADVLCNRIGIITDGILRCIGPQVKLKTLYGGGYHLYINCYKEKYLDEIRNSKSLDLNMDEKLASIESSLFYQDKTITVIKNILPKSNLISSFNGNLVFQIPLEGLKVSKLFQQLEASKEDLKISDWGISQSSLEDVFMEIVNLTSANKDIL